MMSEVREDRRVKRSFSLGGRGSSGISGMRFEGKWEGREFLCFACFFFFLIYLFKNKKTKTYCSAVGVCVRMKETIEQMRRQAFVQTCTT